jgi:hypothetical protein
MATEIQYKVFRELYDEEEHRYSDLATRSNLYLTIITFYLGVIVFRIEDLLKFVAGFGLPIQLFLAIGATLGLALLLTVLAVSIHVFEGVCDPEEVIHSFGESPPSDEDFLDDRIVDLAVATNRNSRQNERVAGFLQWAARLIFLGAFLQVIVFGLAIVHAKKVGYARTPDKATTCQCGPQVNP